MKSIYAGIIGLTLFSVSQSAIAEDRWSWEIRGGAAFATQDLGNSDLGTGLGIEGTLAYQFMPHLAAYFGWDWFHFPSDQPFAGEDVDVEETGYAFGLRFVHPLGESSLDYFLRAGATYNHIEIENTKGDIISDSGHGLGWEIGAGLDYLVGERWHLTPGLRYRSLSRDLDNGMTSTPVDLTYIAVEIGVSRPF